MEYTGLALWPLPHTNMTPEELNRTIEFIVQSQARLAAAQEQDREDRLRFETESRAFDRRLASLFERQTHLLEHQSQLLEGQSQRLDEYEKENRAAQRRHDESLEELHEMMREIRVALNRIIDKLPDRLH